MELVDHFSHNHPLTLSCHDHEEGKDDGGEELVCSGCCLRLVSAGNSAYSCTQCNFFLHKSCAELPKQIINYLHPRHPLTLFAKSPYAEGMITSCDGCKKKFTGFVYHCSLCNFDVDITCASSQENIVRDEGHRHSFMRLRPTSFTCDACGDNRAGELIRSNLCTICQFQVHEECAKLPLTIKQSITHDHQLTLTYYSHLDDDSAGDQICKMCYQKINKQFWFYYCGGCSYICHVGCASSLTKNLKDDTEDESQGNNQLLMPIIPAYSLDLGSITCVVKEISLEENMTLLTNQLEHLGLPHCLTLSNDELKGDDEVCDGCVLPISSPPFYSCAESNFFIHKACIELPNEILHPLHKHPLTLLAKVENMHLIGVFKCSGCRMYGNGFAYACTKCDFFLDLRCSSFSDTFKHEAHEHTLTLLSDFYPWRPDVKCIACGVKCGAKFRCEECNFNLDLNCASLPYATTHECPKHNWEMHPFPLTYKTDAHESGEYYCDMCEEQRGQNDWIYYCEDCDYSGTPTCVFGKNKFKFRKTYEEETIHCHPITLVEAKGKYPSCAHCGDPCRDLALKCVEECDFYIHTHILCEED